MWKLFLFLCVLSFSFSTNFDHTLRFRRNRTFKIAQFADLHFGEGEDVWWGPQQDINSTRVMRNILAMEKPDLVVFSGDQLTGNNINKNATSYWKQVVAPCVEGGYRWAIVFGNHDDLSLQLGDRKILMKFDTSYPNSLSQFGPETIHGVSNYYLPILPSIKNGYSEEIPASMIYFMDSGGGSYDEIVYPDQVEWYRNTSISLKQKYQKTISGVAFFHIPTEEYTGVYSKKICFGMADDGIDTQTQNNGLFATFRDMQNVRATFVGHDHGNDWCCKSKVGGIHVCFGRHTGYGGYGDWARGSRIIVLGEDKDIIVTYVRMEDGTIIDSGPLKSL